MSEERREFLTLKSTPQETLGLWQRILNRALLGDDLNAPALLPYETRTQSAELTKKVKGTVIVQAGAAVTLTLPEVTLMNGRAICFINGGTALLTVKPAAGEAMGGTVNAVRTVAAKGSVTVFCNGAGWYATGQA